MKSQWQLTRAQTATWASILLVAFALGAVMIGTGAGFVSSDGGSDHRIGFLLIPGGIVFAAFALLMTGAIIRQRRRAQLGEP